MMDPREASICEHDVSPSDTRDIKLPYQMLVLEHLAVDVGGSLAKVVYFSPSKHTCNSHSTISTPEHQEDIVKTSKYHTIRQPTEVDYSSTTKLGGHLHFVKFETTHIEDCAQFLKEKLDEYANKKRIIMATGGGAFKYQSLLKEKTQADVYKLDEMACLIEGLNFLLREVPNESFMFSEDGSMEFVTSDRDNVFPYMLVNIGSGVSILKVTDERSFERISGSSLGGGTLWGLLFLLTDCNSFDEMLSLSLKGDNKNVDMLVGDIYGSDYNRVGLKSSVIASNFGKVIRRHDVKEPRLDSPLEFEDTVFKASSETLPYTKREMRMQKFKQEDMAKSLLYMVSDNIGQIAYLNALQHGLKHIYFGGYFIRSHHDTMRTISFAINFWSNGQMKACFLRHEGYLGALGAFLQMNEARDYSLS
jgi:pantothenate kinase